MSRKIKYCRKCGNQIEDNANYCKYCGYRVEVEKYKTQSSGTKNGIRLVAVVLAMAIFAVTAFKYPGFLLPKETTGIESITDSGEQSTAEDEQKGETVKQIDYTATSETDKLSYEKLSAVFEKSGVSVKLTEWVLDDGQEEELQVRSINPLYDPDGEYVIKAYDVSLGDIHELADFIEIRIPYDTTFCDAGEDPADCVGGLYYNEENNAWEEVLYTVDSDAGEIVIETDHFSKFGAITLKNKGRRDAMLCMAGDKITADYDIGYLDENQAVQVMQQLCDTENEESNTAKLAGNEVLQQVMNLGGSLKTVNDGLGTAFSFAYYLDLSDLAMAGRFTDTKPMFWVRSIWGPIPFGTMVDTSASYSNGSSYVYSSEMVNKASGNLSRVALLLCCGCSGKTETKQNRQQVIDSYCKTIGEDADSYFTELSESACGIRPERIYYSIPEDTSNEILTAEPLEWQEMLEKGTPRLILGLYKKTEAHSDEDTYSEQEIRQVLKEVLNRDIVLNMYFDSEHEIYRIDQDGTITVEEISGADGGAYRNIYEYDVTDE